MENPRSFIFILLDMNEVFFRIFIVVAIIAMFGLSQISQYKMLVLILGIMYVANGFVKLLIGE